MWTLSGNPLSSAHPNNTPSQIKLPMQRAGRSRLRTTLAHRSMALSENTNDCHVRKRSGASIRKIGCEKGTRHAACINKCSHPTNNRNTEANTAHHTMRHTRLQERRRRRREDLHRMGASLLAQVGRVDQLLEHRGRHWHHLLLLLTRHSAFKEILSRQPNSSCPQTACPGAALGPRVCVPI